MKLTTKSDRSQPAGTILIITNFNYMSPYFLDLVVSQLPFPWM